MNFVKILLLYLYLYLYIGLEATYKRAWMYLIVIVKYVEGKLCCLYFYLTKKISGRAKREKYRTKDGRKRAIIFSSQENMINLT
jgi:hypothetical protein